MRWGADPDRPTARTRRRGGGRSGLAGLHIRRGGDRWRGDHVSGIVVEHQPDEHLSGRHVDIQPGNIQTGDIQPGNIRASCGRHGIATGDRAAGS